ncbi:hypothetical protein C8R44DRAFT_884776 [Mycena epipterygia]|nr:hypothetical protein C8R44DRAFT_884776 [Mycena epipterygia]
MSPPASPANSQPMRSKAIHDGTESMIALIESEIHTHTAAAEKEIVDLRTTLAAVQAEAQQREASLEGSLASALSSDTMARAELKRANQHIDRLVDVLASLGVSCERNGEVIGYNEEWTLLLEALKAADSEEGSEAEDEGKKVVAMESRPDVADAMRDVRGLLERRQAKAKRWKEKFIEIEIDRDEQKKVMGSELDALRQQLELVQNQVQSSPPTSSSPQ